MEFPEEWNSQGSGIPRGVELPGEWNSQGGGIQLDVHLPVWHELVVLIVLN